MADRGEIVITSRKRKKGNVKRKQPRNEFLYPDFSPQELQESFHQLRGQIVHDWLEYCKLYVAYCKMTPEERREYANYWTQYRQSNPLEFDPSRNPAWNSSVVDFMMQQVDELEISDVNSETSGDSGQLDNLSERRGKKANDCYLIAPTELLTKYQSIINLIAPLNFKRLCKLIPDTLACLKLLAKIGLIANNRDCPKCDVFMTRIKYGEGWIWTCINRKCRKRLSLLHNSFFSKSKFSVEKIMEIIYQWSINTPVMNCSYELDVSERSVIDWYHFLRELCIMYTSDVVANVPVGGPGRIVEIDESVFCKRKHNKGRITKQAWVFGGVERGTNHFFGARVQTRDAATLIPVIKQFVAPGSTIMSDMWSAYLKLDTECSDIYVHGGVNHSCNFVDPNNPNIHTQTVESNWNVIKRKLKKMCGTSPELFASYLHEAIFRRHHSTEDVFSNILLQIRHYYDPNRNPELDYIYDYD